MDTKATLKKLYQIAAKQQETITKLAQAGLPTMEQEHMTAATMGYATPQEGDHANFNGYSMTGEYVFHNGKWEKAPSQNGTFSNTHKQSLGPAAGVTTSSAAIKQLYQIVAKQQETITKLAQMAGAAPVAAPAQAPGEDLSAKLQAALFGAQPGIQAAFIELPSVGTSADGGAKKIVSFKYHMGKNSEAVKNAVAQAATQVLGAGNFLLQGIGQ